MSAAPSNSGEDTLATLQAVPWLGSLSLAELTEVAASARPVRFPAGAQIVGELELGDALYLLLGGRAVASVAAGAGRRELGTLGKGETCGELSLLTRQLRSATVTAVEPVDALYLGRREFGALLERHPAIAVHFAAEIAERVLETDLVLDALLAPATPESVAAAEKLEGKAAAVVAHPGSLQRAWRELVVSHRQELPFLALVSFTLTFLVTRLLARAVEAAGASLFDFLRAAYVLGIVGVFLSTAISLVRFRRGVQRVVAAALGVSLALILNELSVFLAFDSFYLDMKTADPRLVFSVETLYRRSEGAWAVTLMVAFLAQLTFLRRFYRRSGFIVRTRAAGFWSRLRRPPPPRDR